MGFIPNKKKPTDFNGGVQYKNGDSLQAESLNHIIEGLLYAQENGNGGGGSSSQEIEQLKQDVSNLQQTIDDGDFYARNAGWADYAEKDKNGNIIHETYATKERVETFIEDIQDDAGIQAYSARFADEASNAHNDGDGFNIAITYAKKTELSEYATTRQLENVSGNVDALISGQQTAGLAERAVMDDEGNVIHKTYAKKSEVEDLRDSLEDGSIIPMNAENAEYAFKDSKSRVIQETYAEKTELSAHNTGPTAHNDIRLLIDGLTTRLNALANSDDTTLDQMSEVVAYIKANKTLIDSITTSKVNVSDIINNLTTNVTDKPLSAAQGVALKGLIDSLSQNKLSASELQTAINTALAQAKASGEFKGEQGEKGDKGDKGDKGETGSAGKDGADGAKGADGKTPVKGVDYFTATEKAQMVSEVSNAFIQGKNEVYQAVNAVYAQQATNDSNGKNIADTYVKKVDVPDYWLTALQNGAKAINTALCTAGANKSAFLFYSDAHWNYGSQKSPLLLKYLYEHTGMTKTIFGGDIVQNEATDYEAMSYLWTWRNMLKGLPNHHSVVGNHDDGNATNNLFSEQYVYGYLLAPEETSDIIRGDSGMYYYIDSPAEKTRYLYLDTAYKGVTDKQKEFVKNALIQTNEGWHIVAISHIWYDTNYNTTPPSVGALNSDASELLAMFDGYNSRSGEYASGKGWVEFCIGGHTHRDYVGSTTGGIPIILVETDSQHVRSGLGYTAGTTTESSVNGIVADYNTNKVNIIRIGRGSSFIVDITTGGTEEPDTPVTPTYTNMLDTAGFIAGKYLSNGNEVTDANAYTTGYIPCKGGDIIRLKNITMPNESSHGNRFSAYDSSKNWISGTTFSITGSLTDHSPVFEGGNLVQFNVSYFSGMAYIRLSAWKIDETSIITINEPID